MAQALPISAVRSGAGSLVDVVVCAALVGALLAGISMATARPAMALDGGSASSPNPPSTPGTQPTQPLPAAPTIPAPFAADADPALPFYSDGEPALAGADGFLPMSALDDGSDGGAGLAVAVPTVAGAPAPSATPNPSPTPSPAPSSPPKAHKRSAAAQPTKPPANGEKYLGKLGKDLNITGGMFLRSTDDSLSGGSLASQAYSDQYEQLAPGARQLGPFQQGMDLTIQGKVLNAFSIDARLSDAQYGNSISQRFGFNYKSGGTTLDVGSVNASLPGNDLVGFSRTVEGLDVSRDFGADRMKTEAFASMTKATPRRGTFQGNGTSGPYYLGASNILQGSEHLVLDGQNLSSGSDYTINYVTGQVNFNSGRIINASDTVEYTFETQSYDSSPGLLTGARVSFAPIKGTSWGVTYIEQQTVAGATSTGTVTDHWPASGNVTTPYYFSQVLATNATVQIYYLNQLLRAGIDYTLYPAQNYFVLRTLFPADTALTATDSLSATYTPQAAPGVSGNRNVLGLDMSQPLSKVGSFGFEFGESEGDDDDSGTALTLRTSFHSTGSAHKNYWTVTASYRDIGTGFTGIDSVAAAFMQAEKGLVTNFTFAPNDFVKISTALTDSQIGETPTSTVSGTGATTTTPTDASTAVSWVGNRNVTMDVGLTYPHLPTFHLTHSQIDESASEEGASSSSFTNDQFTLAWQKGIFGITGALGRTASTGQSVFANFTNSLGTSETSTATTTVTDTSSTTSRVQISLTPSAWLSMSGSLGISQNNLGGASSTTSGGDSTARDTGLVVNILPRPNLSFTASVSDSDNGESTASFYNPASAATSAGSGTSTSSSSDSTATPLSGQETRTTSLTFQYSPVERMSLNANWNQSLSLVPGYDDTQSVSSDVGVSYVPTNHLQLAMQVGTQNVTYVGGLGNSSNSTYSLTATAGPYGRVSLTSALERMNFGSAVYSSGFGTSTTNTGFGSGTTTTATSDLLQQGLNTVWSLRSDYAIGPNRSLYLQWQSIVAAAPVTSLSSTDTDSTSSTDSITSGFTAQNYASGTATLGFEIRLSKIMAFTLDANIIQMRDADDADYSYRARSLNTNLTASF